MHGVGTSQARDCGSCRARKRRTQVLAMGSCVCVCARTSACARSLRALTRHYTPPHTHLQPPRTGAVIACRLLMCLIVLDVCSHRLRPIRRQLSESLSSAHKGSQMSAVMCGEGAMMQLGMCVARGRETGRTRGHPHARGAVALREITRPRVAAT